MCGERIGEVDLTLTGRPGDLGGEGRDFSEEDDPL